MLTPSQIRISPHGRNRGDLDRSHMREDLAILAALGELQLYLGNAGYKDSHRFPDEVGKGTMNLEIPRELAPKTNTMKSIIRSTYLCLLSEASICWNLLKSNLDGAFIPFPLFTMASLLHKGASRHEIIVRLVCME